MRSKLIEKIFYILSLITILLLIILAIYFSYASMHPITKKETTDKKCQKNQNINKLEETLESERNKNEILSMEFKKILDIQNKLFQGKEKYDRLINSKVKEVEKKLDDEKRKHNEIVKNYERLLKNYSTINKPSYIKSQQSIQAELKMIDKNLKYEFSNIYVKNFFAELKISGFPISHLKDDELISFLQDFGDKFSDIEILKHRNKKLYKNVKILKEKIEKIFQCVDLILDFLYNYCKTKDIPEINKALKKYETLVFEYTKLLNFVEESE